MKELQLFLLVIVLYMWHSALISTHDCAMPSSQLKCGEVPNRTKHDQPWQSSGREKTSHTSLKSTKTTNNKYSIVGLKLKLSLYPWVYLCRTYPGLFTVWPLSSCKSWVYLLSSCECRATANRLSNLCKQIKKKTLCIRQTGGTGDIIDTTNQN